MKTLFCEEVQNRLSFYVEDSLTAPEREEVAAHLEACHACRAEVEAYHNLRRGMQALKAQQRDIEPPAHLWKQARRGWDERDARQTHWNRARVAVVATLLLCFMGISWARYLRRQPFPMQVIAQDYEQITQAGSETKLQLVTSDAGRASTWLQSQIGGSIPPVPLSVSGAKLLGAGVLSGEQSGIGRLVYETPKGVLVLYVAPRRVDFANAKPTEIDGRAFYLAQPNPQTTLLAWEYNTVGMGMLAHLTPKETSPYALDARRLTSSLP